MGIEHSHRSFAWMRRMCFALCAAALVAACGGGGDAGVDAKSVPADGIKQAQAASVQTLAFTAHGWYWNPAEGGTGFMFEAQGSQGFAAFFMYEEGTGKPVWYAAGGNFTANQDGSYAFSGDLRYYSNGQAVTSPVYVSPQSRSVGTVQIRFSGQNASVLLPGRSIAATRYDFAGLSGATSASQPEVGWYWNPDEGGRGYAIEVQNNKVFIAMFHYNEDGSPTWNVVDGDISSGSVTNPFQVFSGGQSLTSAFRPPGKHFDLGSFTLSFRNPCAGQMQRAGTPAVSIRRFVFGDLAPSAECRTLAGMADVPGVQAGPARLQPGDAMFGMIDAAGDTDAYGIALEANVSYRFDLQGSTSGMGTLDDPLLALYDSQLRKIAENDDGGGQLDSRITFTPSASGMYYLAAQGFGATTGSFALASSGLAAGLSVQPVPALASYAGTFDGVLVGRQQGWVTLAVDSQGTLSGSILVSGSAQGALQISGLVASGGVARFAASNAGATLVFVGFIGPQGDVSGTWSDAAGAGGIFMGARRGSLLVSAPQL